MGDTESCSSRAVDFSPDQNRKHKLKVHIYNEVLRRLSDLNVAESRLPGFEDELWIHFNRLPARYALDVNVERAEDVLMHKRLLQMAHDPTTRPAVEVRPVQVHFSNVIESQRRTEARCSHYGSKQSIHPPPAFDLSPDLKLSLEADQLCIQNRDHVMNSNQLHSRPMHEITISTNDKPKLFSQLTSLISEIGLNIQEAHAFSTVDGYSLDVFLVDNWAPEETTQLKEALAKEIPKIEKLSRLNHVITPVREQELGVKLTHSHMPPMDGSEIKDIDLSLLKFGEKIASGSFSDSYKGTFCNQDVAIKVLRTEHVNETIHREFAQEVDIMRKIQHENVVQFVGACIRPPTLCIVTEFMSGGNVYDFLRQCDALSLQSVLKIAIDVSKGMNYLHQNNIIHRDLKAANLLMDKDGVVKVSDFGVARVQAQSGAMTAETGTYRWMAPEVIEHKPYDHKADVFSFGIVVWELLTGKLPYDNLTPLQAAVGVVQKGLRPAIPAQTHAMLVELLGRCWQQEPSRRPEFSEIQEILQNMTKRVTGEKRDRQKGKLRAISAFVRGRNPSAN